MRAAILHALGEVPEVGELDDPAPGDGAEVLEVLAGGVNPVDVRIASGTFPAERREPPYVAGKEGVGRRADGGLVYFDASREPFGAFAQRTLVDAGSGYAVPDGLEPALAVCLGVSGIAAWLTLEWRGALRAGESMLVLGATGVVGQIAVQVAKLLGAGRVVAAGRDKEALRRATALGADALVPLPSRPHRLADPRRRAQRRRPARGSRSHDEWSDVAGALREASGGAGFDLVLDPLWGEPARAALAALKPFGRLVHFGQSAASEVTLGSSLVRGKPVSILGYTTYAAGEERKAAAFDRLAAHAVAGDIRVEIERLGLDDVPDAWRRVGTSPHRKLVVIP